jgi:hypothetical protein
MLEIVNTIRRIKRGELSEVAGAGGSAKRGGCAKQFWVLADRRSA